MTRSSFPLFQSHLDLAHRYWHQILRPGDLAVDATCGNGRDTQKLLELVGDTGRVAALDIQDSAIEETRERCDNAENLHLYRQCHSSFPEEVSTGTAALVVYNLGYLPGADKDLITRSSTTLQSLKAAAGLVRCGGLISVTCYPGHPGGEEETKEVLRFASSLDPAEWSVCRHQWLNRRRAPSLLLLQRMVQGGATSQ